MKRLITTRAGMNYYHETVDPLIEVSIGTTFKVSGKWVRVVYREKDGSDDCGNCVFCAQKGEKDFCLCQNMACLEEERDDCNDVNFEAVEII